ncbi:MAG: ABC transporter permease [Bacteroidota bacterium]
MKRIGLHMLSGFVILLPFVLLMGLSLMQAWRFPALQPEVWTLSNWTQLLGQQEDLALSLGMSLLLSISVATLATILGFWSSRFLAYHPWSQLWLILTYLPFVLSPVIYAVCVNFFFILWGLSGSIIGVFLGQMMIAYPFAIILFSRHWTPQVQSLEQLTLTLGGSRRQLFARVLLPISKGMLLVCFFQTFLISWFEYGLTTLIGVGKIQTLTLKVYQYVNEANIYFAALASCLLFLPPLILIWVNKRFVFRPIEEGRGGSDL